MVTTVERADRVALEASSELAKELRGLLRKGLPPDPRGDWPRLGALASVSARAGADATPAGRAEALDGVLRRVLGRIEPEGLRSAAKALFGLPPASPGLTLTVRRDLAAKEAGREVNHFRKRVEPEILVGLAVALERDAASQTAPWASAPPVRKARSRRRLPPDVYAWEAAEHEEALTRLWACVYALRAELLAVERQVSMGDPTDATADAALWRYGQMQAQARRYRAAYGGELLPDGAAPHDLADLAGWTPALSPAQLLLVADASSSPDPVAFAAAVRTERDGDALVSVWRTALTSDPDKETTS
ncbi:MULTISPECIES: hypothetical protein [unclassified Streptomyces]|uniref:hypothetical protein n=1 Tax=Streptomyces sp. NPDC055082 TaxID=3365718 RepID=UPI0037D7E2CA